MAPGGSKRFSQNARPRTVLLISTARSPAVSFRLVARSGHLPRRVRRLEDASYTYRHHRGVGERAQPARHRDQLPMSAVRARRGNSHTGSDCRRHHQARGGCRLHQGRVHTPRRLSAHDQRRVSRVLDAEYFERGVITPGEVVSGSHSATSLSRRSDRAKQEQPWPQCDRHLLHPQPQSSSSRQCPNRNFCRLCETRSPKWRPR